MLGILLCISDSSKTANSILQCGKLILQRHVLQAKKLVDFDRFVKMKLAVPPATEDLMNSWASELSGTLVTTVWGWLIKTIIQHDPCLTKTTNYSKLGCLHTFSFPLYSIAYHVGPLDYYGVLVYVQVSNLAHRIWVH